MTQIHHLNGGILQREIGKKIPCHCLVLQDANGWALIDTGIGILDGKDPVRRIGLEQMNAAGFQFDPIDTIHNQLLTLGIQPYSIKHCILSHLDCDHTGGLADFPDALVHVSEQEFLDFNNQIHPRYVPAQLEHNPSIKTYNEFNSDWFGFKAVPIDIGFSSSLLFIFMPGHTKGHCGVAIRQKDGWMLFCGDAFYMKEEILDRQHPVHELSRANALDSDALEQTLDNLMCLKTEHAGNISIISYHDSTQFPELPERLR